ncbi:MAG: PDC sensor domain-containing protein, partial [Rhodospirillaceae bacterium]|nr:PDC sensor domain-containing protein [Rhodospirillaceae bacterium]
MAKQKSVKAKIALLSGLCIFVTATSIIAASIFFARDNKAFVDQNVSDILGRTTENYLQNLAANQASLLRAQFEEALHAARAEADILSIVGAPHTNGTALEMRRKIVLNILHQTLQSNPSLNGTYSAWEPNAIDGRDELFRGNTIVGSDKTGRLLPYWTRDPKTGLIALQPLVEYDSRALHPNGVMKGGWYIGPQETGKESVLGPLPYIVQGRSVFLATLSVPIKIDGKFVGVAGTDFNLDFVQDLATKASANLFEGKNEVVILSDLGLIVADSLHADQIGQSFAGRSTTWNADLALIKSGKGSTAWSQDGTTLRLFQPIALGNTGKPWSVLITVPRDVVMADAGSLSTALEDRAERSVGWQIGMGIGITVVAIIAIWLAAGGISRPIIAMTGAMR